VNPEGPKEVILDKGYHSNNVLVELADLKVRSYCSEPERARRRWEGKKEEQAVVYANRRRIEGSVERACYGSGARSWNGASPTCRAAP